MATTSAQNFASPYSASALCRIVGIACVAGFLFDILVLALPPALGSAEWRISFLQQVGDRSIVLLFGAALLTYGNLENRGWRKPISMVCLVLGTVFLLLCIAAIRDGLALNDLATKNIENQAAKIQSQIQTRKDKPEPDAKITPEQLQEASKLIDARAGTLKEGAKNSIFKTAIAVVGNLAVMGIAFISLGRYGMRSRKA